MASICITAPLSPLGGQELGRKEQVREERKAIQGHVSIKFRGRETGINCLLKLPALKRRAANHDV